MTKLQLFNQRRKCLKDKVYCSKGGHHDDTQPRFLIVWFTERFGGGSKKQQIVINYWVLFCKFTTSLHALSNRHPTLRLAAGYIWLNLPQLYQCLHSCTKEPQVERSPSCARSVKYYKEDGEISSTCRTTGKKTTTAEVDICFCPNFITGQSHNGFNCLTQQQW